MFMMEAFIPKIRKEFNNFSYFITEDNSQPKNPTGDLQIVIAINLCILVFS